ncbi:MAG: hypothetical protein ACQEQL_03300 [Pseudomonadota bacterium]
MIKTKLKNLPARLSAIATVGFMMGVADAQAQIGFQDATDNIVTSSSDLPNLISTVAYIGGAGLGVAGVLKMKQHVDNPSQTPLKDGLVRLGAGGGLLALPFVLESMSTTIGSGGKVGAVSLPTVGSGP